MIRHLLRMSALLLLSVGCTGTALLAGDFNEQRASFAVEIGELTIPFQVFFLSVMPAEQIVLETRTTSTNGKIKLEPSAGTIIRTEANHWQWKAPSGTGLCHLVFRDPATQDSILLNVFVLEPYKNIKNGYLNGYRIGAYPSKPLRDLPIYNPPPGFIEVTEEMLAIQISPHFKLWQFLCKQESDYPKYIVLRELLLLKLEYLLKLTNERGFACQTFFVMSGFRTPHYNQSIGNVKYSRHCWGGAADIFIDVAPEDGMMDDLNGDGVSNWKDSAVMYEIVDNLYGSERYEPYVGGLGQYKKTNSHGPFIHVDVRGFRARWGD